MFSLHPFCGTGTSAWVDVLFSWISRHHTAISKKCASTYESADELTVFGFVVVSVAKVYVNVETL